MHGPDAEPPAGPNLPLGVVTFLMTDVESSTRLWRESPEAAALIARQTELIAAAVARHGGVRPLEQGEGDSTVAAFARASDALAAALEAQRALAGEPWPESARVRVRMAVHTGEAELRGAGAYGGSAIIRCARLRSLAHGGQVLVSTATREVVGDGLPADAMLVALGTVQLKGFDRSERVHQLCHPDLPSTFPPLTRAGTGGLGLWPTALVGRLRERGEVAALLATDRLVTITGAGGAGKTRLAHAVGEDLADRYADGVVWVELARLSDGAQVAGTVAGACGVREAAGVAAIDLLGRALAESRMLVVLDNCEHLLEDCARVAEALMRAGRGVSVLATGREPLGVTGEVTWRIPPLALPPEGERDSERLGAYDSVCLFVERARAARPGFRLDAGSAPVVTRICRRLDGLPLALELAAARVRTLSVERLADGLDDRFRLLTGGARTALARQQTLLASVEWSHDLLDEPERLLFRRLGVFAAPFDVEAVEAVAADDQLDPLEVVDLLSRLVDKNMVQPAGDRYQLLETLRQYALERAADAGELAELRSRHLAWFRRRAAAWGVDREVTTFPVLEEIAAEAPDLLAALEWSLGPGRRPAADLLYALAWYWGRRFAHEKLRAVSGQVLAALDEGSVPWLEALAPVADELYFATELGWVPAARRALDTLSGEIAPAVRGLVEHALSLGPAFLGLLEGVAGLERAAEAGRAAGNRNLEVMSLLTIASLLAQQGERGRVRRLLAWLDRHVPPDAVMRFLLDQTHANAMAFDGDFAGARARLEPYLDRSCEFSIATQVGLIALWTEDAPLARRAVAAAERNLAAGAFATAVSWLRAVVPLVEGRFDDALRALGEEPSPWTMGTSSFRLRCMGAEVALSLGDAGRAAVLLDEAEPRLAGTVLHYFAGVVHLLRAHLARGREDVREAEARAHQALDLAAEHELGLLTVDTLETLALLAADVGNDVQAGRLLGVTDAFRQRTGYRWRYPYRRRAIEALRPRLDAAHVEEGAQLTLADAVAWARRGRGERRRPNHGWDSLTPTETRVVELVAAGLPNREIASKLFVSLATVKTHLVHVYTKVDVRTRAQLAAAATSREAERRRRAGAVDPQPGARTR